VTGQSQVFKIMITW